jgi:hypothetical protein
MRLASEKKSVVLSNRNLHGQQALSDNSNSEDQPRRLKGGSKGWLILPCPFARGSAAFGMSEGAEPKAEAAEQGEKRKR